MFMKLAGSSRRNPHEINHQQSLKILDNLHILIRVLLLTIFNFKFKQTNAFSPYRSESEPYSPVFVREMKRNEK